VNRKSVNLLSSIRQSVRKLGGPFPAIPDNLHSSNESPFSSYIWVIFSIIYQPFPDTLV